MTRNILIVLASFALFGASMLGCGEDGNTNTDATGDVVSDADVGIDPYIMLERGAPPQDKPCGMELYNFAFSADPLVIVRYGYDADGRVDILDTVTPSGGIEFRVVRYFDEAGRLTESLHMPVGDRAIEYRHQFEWDAEGRVVKDEQVNEISGRVMARTEWTYNSPESWVVTYDRNGDGTPEETETYMYDAGLFVINRTITPANRTDEIVLKAPLETPAHLDIYEIFEFVQMQSVEGDSNGDGLVDYETQFQWMGNRLLESTFNGQVSQTTRYQFQCD